MMHCREIHVGKPRKRTGKTLTELMVVMSLLGTLTLLTGTMLTRLGRADRAVVADIRWQRALVELSEQFRLDAHQATAAEVAPDGLRVVLRSSATSIEYRRDGEHLVRTLVDAGQPGQHWPTPAVTFASATIARRPGIELRLPTPDGSLLVMPTREGTPRPVVIRATLATGVQP